MLSLCMKNFRLLSGAAVCAQLEHHTSQKICEAAGLVMLWKIKQLEARSGTGKVVAKGKGAGGGQ